MHACIAVAGRLSSPVIFVRWRINNSCNYFLEKTNCATISCLVLVASQEYINSTVNAILRSVLCSFCPESGPNKEEVVNCFVQLEGFIYVDSDGLLLVANAFGSVLCLIIY